MRTNEGSLIPPGPGSRSFLCPQWRGWVRISRESSVYSGPLGAQFTMGPGEGGGQFHSALGPPGVSVLEG